MKISLNWLKDYIDLEGISTGEIVSQLTMSGLEVEEYTDQKEIYKDFIVGFVKEKGKHPNADKLSLCTVSNGKEDLQVICGAPNVAAGQKVVFAPIGTLIPKGSFKIGKAKIRGVESYGMICSEAELELSDNHEGIMVLDENLKEGTPITEALSLNDTVFEIAITPNRPDALSHIGVARDLAALFGRELRVPEISIKRSKENVKQSASVEIEDAVNCPRYSALVVKNVTVKESPEWLKNRLRKIGLRPISNIVDVTNFVMYECGQPLHAFDLKMLSGQKIIVKSTEKESEFTTLDSKLRKLPAGTLMICDAEKPVAIAGVMGGENSEISNDTKDILIESAHFNPGSIRKTSKSLGLGTEASYRFERWVDPGSTLFAAERAAQLIAELSGGEAADGNIDVYPNEIKEKEVLLRLARVKKILGYDIPKEDIQDILEKLGFKIILDSESQFRYSIPTYRSDVEREIDLIEEIARIYGYDNIPTIEKISITLGERIDQSDFADQMRNNTSALGFYEMINNPLLSSKAADITGEKIAILNPQSQDMAYLRTSLIPGALLTVAKNINVGERNLNLFEIGNVFNGKEGKSRIKSFDDFTESSRFLILITGKLSEKGWNSEEKSADFYSLKGVINGLMAKISLDNVLNDSYYHDENSIFDFRLDKIYEKSIAGSGGKIRKDVLKQFDIQQDVYCFEFDLKILSGIKTGGKKFAEPLKYPKVVKDFAFIFDKSVTFREVADFIGSTGSKILKSADLFDLFESESLGSGKKSMAFTLEYYSTERTLTEEEVEKEFLSLIDSVAKKFDAKLRGN